MKRVILTYRSHSISLLKLLSYIYTCLVYTSVYLKIRLNAYMYMDVLLFQTTLKYVSIRPTSVSV